MCTDNWYTSVDLVETLAAPPRSMHFVGTVKVNKRGLEKPALFSKTGPNKQQRGSMVCVHRALNNASIPVLYQTSWMDSKPVHLLSTFPPNFAPCSRGGRTPTGGFTVVNVPRPTVIAAYNQGMGGTDKIDQLVNYYDDRYRTLKWQMRIYMHFLHVAVVNASILYNCSQDASDKKRFYTLLDA